MRVLIACEESQIVTQAFRDQGHEAFSCDIQECSGGHPEWHYKEDVYDLLPGNWDLIIAHPPCTYLCSAQLWMCQRDPVRQAMQMKAIEFIDYIWSTPCKRIAIENPIGCLQGKWKSWDQLIYPYEFGDPYKKDICLWLKGLPKLIKGPYSPGRRKVENHVNGRMSQAEKSKIKSKFFPGVAKAMATQWGKIE